MRTARFLLLGLILGGTALVAQSTTAEITGKVTDASGASVPGAAITVLNVDTGTKRDTSSNEAGIYSAPALQPGNYRVTVQKEGFRPVSRSGITLTVDQVSRIDFRLEVGGVSETVDVK